MIKSLEKVDLFLFRVSMLAAFIMMVITTIDVLARYFFHSSIIGVYEFTEYYLMVGTVFLSMSYVMKLDGHISLDLLIRKFPEKWRMYLKIFNYCLMMAFLLLVVLTGIERTIDAFTANKVGTGLVAWPFWISYILVPIGTSAFFLRILFNIFMIIYKLIKKQYNNQTGYEV